MAESVEKYPRTFNPDVDDAEDLYRRGATIGERCSDGTLDLYWDDEVAEIRQRISIPTGLVDVRPVDLSAQS